jgi:hypothetical protein
MWQIAVHHKTYIDGHLGLYSLAVRIARMAHFGKGANLRLDVAERIIDTAVQFLTESIKG